MNDVFNFVVDYSAEAVKESGGGKFISTSGIYDVVLKFAALSVKESGVTQVNLNVEYEGNSQTIYGLTIYNKDGSENFAARIFNSLCVINGIEGKPALEVQTHKVGKDQKETDFTVFSDLCDVPVKIWVQEEYSLYKGEIQDRLVPRGFFRAGDGASAEEIVLKTEPGVRLAKVIEKYASNVKYDEGLTKEIVDAYKEDKKNGKKTAVAPAVTAPKINPFAKKV